MNFLTCSGSQEFFWWLPEERLRASGQNRSPVNCYHCFVSSAIAVSHSRIFAANRSACPESAGINVPRSRNSEKRSKAFSNQERASFQFLIRSVLGLVSSAARCDRAWAELS